MHRHGAAALVGMLALDDVPEPLGVEVATVGALTGVRSAAYLIGAFHEQGQENRRVGPIRQ